MKSIMHAGLSVIITLVLYVVFKYSYIAVDAGFYPLFFMSILIFLEINSSNCRCDTKMTSTTAKTTVSKPKKKKR